MPFYVYILYSQTLDRYYVGHSNDLQDRLRRHNSSHKGFTGKAADWKTVYSEVCPDKSHALRRERQIKAWKSRAMLENLLGKN